MENKIFKIKSIKKIESKSKRYDIQTKIHNNFFANNILVHNSCIQVYFDWNDKVWYAGTTGTAEGEGEVNNKNGTTFNQLFWNTVKEKYNLDSSKFIKGFTYVFELTTPENLVVVPHGIASATLLTVRNLDTLKEVSFEELTEIAKELGVPRVKSYDLNTKDVGVLLRSFDNMSWKNEGYVVVDGNHNRIKVKNPAYVAVHHTKNKTAEHYIIEIVKTNEIEEYCSVFPDRKKELFLLKENYDNLLLSLTNTWIELKPYLPKNITAQEKKRFAEAVFNISEKNGVKKFSGLYFGLLDGKISSIEEFLINYDSKALYKML